MKTQFDAKQQEFFEDEELSRTPSLSTARSEWDEGGASQCGYSQIVHDTLMSIGHSVHRIIGDPPSVIEKEMKNVGGWFQEASYAVRDYTRGDVDVKQETHDVVSTIISGGSAIEKEMKNVGGWFQEASYAVRDYTRGNSDVEPETDDEVDWFKPMLEEMNDSCNLKFTNTEPRSWKQPGKHSVASTVPRSWKQPGKHSVATRGM
jgi:hypothetical protein